MSEEMTPSDAPMQRANAPPTCSSASSKATRRLADEENRHSDMVTKTARLREQCLARDAAEAGAKKNEAKRAQEVSID